MNTNIQITVNGDKIVVNKGAVLSDILKSRGYRFAMPCGGRGICRKCKVSADGKEVLACKYIVTQPVDIVLPEFSDGKYEELIEKAEGVCRISTDIGTTTVETAVTDSEGKMLARVRFANPQSVYGADVVNRIEYCSENGAKALQKILVDEIKSRLKNLLGKSAKVERMDFAGNTVMTHLLMGKDCSSMGQYPYTPLFLDSQTTSAKELGFEFDCEAHTLPCISAFVGGDTVAGLLTLPEPSRGRYSLYMDLGTNAEIVLLGNKSYTATSAPAGPCMEGANISCGMSAVDGAITHFKYPDKVEFLGEKPSGLCGSGLIDVVGQLYKSGVIDDSGDMREDFRLVEGVILKREDVRQYQLAKSAIRAATEELLEYKKVNKRNIERVYLAGGFSSHTDVDNAVATGLIAKEFDSICIAVGNCSLKGCILYNGNKKKADAIAADAEYLDLNSRESFSEKFIKFMNFGI